MRYLLSALLVLLAGSLPAAVVTKTIAYNAGDTEMKGFLAYNDAVTSKAPGVLVVPEWWGLNDYPKMRAQKLAELGYVAFVADMYGEGKVTTDPKQAGAWAGAVKGSELIRTRSRAALDELARQPQVDPKHLAAIGYCFGGSTVLELAYGGAPVVGVVSFHGELRAPKPGDAAPVRAKIAILHGASDTFQPEADIEKIRAALTKNGADWQMVYYAHAVHAFTNPNADKAGIPGVAYNAAADHRSWQFMRDFLREVFSAR